MTTKIKTMREFDKSCLVPIKTLAAQEITEIRTYIAISQKVFALYLNVTVGSVSRWERGDSHPNGPALKLLDLVRKKGWKLSLERLSIIIAMVSNYAKGRLLITQATSTKLFKM